VAEDAEDPAFLPEPVAVEIEILGSEILGNEIHLAGGIGHVGSFLKRSVISGNALPFGR
jgi:hypothetical protein